MSSVFLPLLSSLQLPAPCWDFVLSPLLVTKDPVLLEIRSDNYALTPGPMVQPRHPTEATQFAFHLASSPNSSPGGSLSQGILRQLLGTSMSCTSFCSQIVPAHFFLLNCFGGHMTYIQGNAQTF